MSSNNTTEIIFKLNDQIFKGLGAVRSKLEDTASKLEKIEQKSKAFEKIRQGTVIAGGSIIAGLEIATAKAVQFESALAPVKKVLRGTAEEVEQASYRIGKHALSWSEKYKNSATSSALLGTLYNNFGDKANNADIEMMKLYNTVAKTQQLLQIANLGQLNEGLKYAASSALSFKVSFDQTSAVVGQLNTLGITGSMAGTSFNGMMRTLYKGSNELGYAISRTSDGGVNLIKTLRNISEVGASADVIQKVFGDEGAKGINLLTAKIGELDSNFTKVQNSMGATETAFKKMNNTSQTKLTVFFDNINNIGVAIRALATLAMNIDVVMQWWNHLIIIMKEMHRVVAWLGNILDAMIGNLFRTITWIVDKFKESSADALPNLEQKITPVLDTKNVYALNDQTVRLPVEDSNFLAKNGIGSSGYMRTATMKKVTQNQGKSIKESTTVINIDKVEISDGVISNFEDFVLQLNQRVAV